jgi:hypothetical protein
VLQKPEQVAIMLQQLYLYWDIFLPALMVPLSIAIVVLMIRETFHSVWTPAVDVFAILLASELVILFEHKRLGEPAIGVDLIEGVVILLCITLPLLVGSLIVEKLVIRFYFFHKVGSKARKRTLLLWASAVTIFAGQLALLLGAKREQIAPKTVQTVMSTFNIGK